MGHYSWLPATLGILCGIALVWAQTTRPPGQELRESRALQAHAPMISFASLRLSFVLGFFIP